MKRYHLINNNLTTVHSRMTEHTTLHNQTAYELNLIQVPIIQLRQVLTLCSFGLGKPYCIMLRNVFAIGGGFRAKTRIFKLVAPNPP